ncbi:hypothetical protein [Yinghuangia soli]|uniref:Uncharacterized protein n=1 Tax=Yinghuangia soli TaxID=2908204 RepID=A0AA41U2K6_9ACTN|nr:hypothetical protein [Yinghuangia soli]MCF2527204.1 hypothetical protein [Yinghuangia soli]
MSLNARSGAGGTDPSFCAVYADASGLWFQAGSRRWRVDDDVRFVRDAHERPGACRFSIVVGSQVAASWGYSGPLADPVNQADPAFDGMEEELQDIRLFLARVGNDPEWRRRFGVNRNLD